MKGFISRHSMMFGFAIIPRMLFLSTIKVIGRTNFQNVVSICVGVVSDIQEFFILQVYQPLYKRGLAPLLVFFRSLLNEVDFEDFISNLNLN